jgi:hypothetical protein
MRMLSTFIQAAIALTHAPTCCASLCIGAPLATLGATARRDSDGQPACELCGARLSRVKHHRAHGPGRSCHPQCKSMKRPIDERSTSAITQPIIPRCKRPYDSLGPTQKWKRRQLLLSVVTEAEQQIGCPLASVQPSPKPTPAELLHLTTAERDRIRTVPSLRIPCEQAMTHCKQQLATSHATATGTFAGGAYMTDPLAYVSVLCAQSPFIAVGGDAGGGRCALGVTYSHQSIQHFAALLVYDGSDSWLELQDCRAEGLTPFIGDSAAFPHIWAVLQHLIDARSAYLNGDWCFLNAVLGLMSPAATHPCPICIVSHKSFLNTARYRQTGDKHSVDRTHTPLLTIPPERIVPTPLHLFLGISNRIILDAFTELLGEAAVVEAVASIKTIPAVASATCTISMDRRSASSSRKNAAHISSLLLTHLPPSPPQRRPRTPSSPTG